MYKDNKVLGKLVKEKRLEKNLTRQMLADKIGVGIRHIFSLEHEGGNPSYKVLRDLVYTLELPPSDIFYPQNVETNSELTSLFNMIKRCNQYQLSIVQATIKAILENEYLDDPR